MDTPTGRYVVEIPLRLSGENERRALARMRTAQSVANEILAEYLRRANAYKRDPDYRALLAESREARRDGRRAARTSEPASLAKAKTPRNMPVRFYFTTELERIAAWNALRERHGLATSSVSKLTPAGLERHEATKLWVRGITARLRALGDCGLDSKTVNHEIFGPQRDRVLTWLGLKSRKGNAKKGRPSFASRRFPITSVTGSSSQPEDGALLCDIAAATFRWKAGSGAFPIVGRLLIDERDGWLRRALRVPIAQTRVLHRTVGTRRRWYVQLVMVGAPPVHPRILGSRTHGVVGVDVGIRHIAAVGETSALLADLAPTMLAREVSRDGRIGDVRDGDQRKRDRYYRRLSRAIARRRARHPDNVDAISTRTKTLVATADGRANGKMVEVPSGYRRGSRLVTSARVERDKARLAALAAVDAIARDNDHGRLANAIATMGDRIVLERLSYVGFQRAFGRQTRRFAPGAFVARLAWRARVLGGNVFEVPTALRMSQVCHCGVAVKTPIRGPISARTKPPCACGRGAIHRDMYSAFLARHASETSVDLPAASAAWAGALGLLEGASTAYDTAEIPRLPRVFRASERTLSTGVPVVHVGISPPSSSTPRVPAASVRLPATAADDGPSRERLGDVVLPQDRSRETAWTPLGDIGPPKRSNIAYQRHCSISAEETLIA